MASNVSGVYIHVIDDVIAKVRDEFLGYGVGEGVLTELQALWEAKMLQSGTISVSGQHRSRMAPPAAGGGGGGGPVHDLNVPYEGPLDEYETPTAEMLFPPTPLLTPSQTPLPGSIDYNIPTGNSDFGSGSDGREIDLKGGIPSPYMPPPSPWMNQRPLGVDVNVAYVEGREDHERGASQQGGPTQDFFMMSAGKRKRDDYASRLTTGGYIPQQDGGGDVLIEFVLLKANGDLNSRSGGEIAVAAIPSNKVANAASVLPQLDGIDDEYDNLFPYEGVATEDYNAVNTPADHGEHRVATPSVGTPKVAKSEALDDDEPPLNEDDDDDDDLDDVERGEEEPLTQHLVLAQFDKVTRTKSRWKCTLKDGIMHINNREMLFNKANGEFDF